MFRLELRQGLHQRGWIGQRHLRLVEIARTNNRLKSSIAQQLTTGRRSGSKNEGRSGGHGHKPRDLFPTKLLRLFFLRMTMKANPEKNIVNKARKAFRPRKQVKLLFTTFLV